MNFAQNIRYLRAKKELSQEKLGMELSITRNQVASYESEKADPSIETLIKFSEFFKLPIDALVKSDLTKGKENSFIDIGNHRVLFPIQIDEHNNNVVEVVNKEASAGYLNGYSDTEFIAQLPIMNLPFLPTGKHRAFKIKGDSMSPWVNDGDYVIGEYVENFQEVRNNACYVILTKNDGLVYKRIINANIKEGFVTLSSDNKTYHPYQIHLSDVLEIWGFKLNLRIGQYKEDELNPIHLLNLMRSVGIELKDLKEKYSRIETKLAN